MTDTSAAYCDVTSLGVGVSYFSDVRRVGRAAAVGFAAAASICLLIAAVTAVAGWIVAGAFSAKPHLEMRTPAGPAIYVKNDRLPVLSELTQAPVSASLPSTEPDDVPRSSFASRWGAVMPARATTRLAAREEAPAVASASNENPRGTANAETQHVAAGPAAPVPAPSEPKSAAPKPAHNKSIALADVDSRTAVYDISARTVYMPNGDKLEAHSGLAEKMDNPRYVHVRMRGPTPPNVYNLTMRERLFHGVRALRLNPVNEGKMFGRDGMLAHTYMLGSNGQSNGCVSFKDYSKFLRAYLNGEVNRLVVVSRLGDTPLRAARAGQAPDQRYAAADEPAPDKSLTW